MDNIPKITPLSSGPHPEYKPGNKFIFLSYSEYSKPGDILTLNKNYNTEMSDFCNTEGRLVTTFWNRVAPYPEEPAIKKMSDSQFYKLRYSFVEYENLMETVDRLEEVMTIYYMKDADSYNMAKKLAENLTETIKDAKRKIMEILP